MSSVVRKPGGSDPSPARRSGASRPARRHPVMGMPDILAMTTVGALPPGKKLTLPSGAVWEGGRSAGTSTITFPDDDPLLVDSGESPESAGGTPVRMDALARAFQGVLGVMPRIFADWVASGGGREQARTSTRILRMSARTTFQNPYRPGQPDGERDEAVTDSGLADRTPIRRASGGMVSGPGGPRDDAILARLSDGEYVVNAAATSRALPLLDAINAGWVPSPAYLARMLPGFAAGGLVDSAGNNGVWRDLLARNLAKPVVPGAVTGTDFGLFGLVGDAFGAIADGALNAGGRAGSALGAAIAPAFGPGGVVSRLFSASGGASTGPMQNFEKRDLPSGAPNPLAAFLHITPQGTSAIPRTAMLPGLSGLLSGDSAGTDDGMGEMARLAEALGQGIESVAADAGARVGSALGSAIGPALGPSGALAPEIGAQLGAMIGSKFGGSLRASMTMTGTTPVDPATGAGTGAPTVDGGAVAPTGTAPVAPQVGAGGTLPGIPIGGEDGIPLQYLLPGGRLTPALSVREGGTVQSMLSALRTDAPKSLGAAVPQAKSLEQVMRPYDPVNGSVADFAQVAGAKLGVDFGIGENAGRDIGDLFGAVASLDPEGQWAPTLAMGVGNLLGIDFRPDQQEALRQNPSVEQQIGFAAMTGAVQGLRQRGLVGGLTGAISGAASTAGSLLGSAAGTALAGFLGPAAPLAPAIGSAIGSMAASTVSNLVTQPIEYAAQTAKEVIGTGFGLTDLAEGPGGRTARQDIYNFNGMDPKSAAIAVERVNRRRTLAQQRGGGLGR